MTYSCVPSSLPELSSEVLTQRLGELFGEERRCLVDFLWHLAEMDRRHGFVALGYSSTFDWCTRALRLPAGSAWRRTTAARLLLKFPAIDGYLRDNRLCMTTLNVLRDVLDPENHRALLEQAADKTEDEVKVLVASLRPLSEVPESIRRVPARPAPKVETPSLFVAVESSTSGPAPTVNTVVVPRQDPTPAPAGPRRPRVEPIDATRHSVKFTAGPEFMALLREAKAALSHVVPDGNLEAVLRVCMEKTLEVCTKRQRAVRKRPEQRSTDAATNAQDATEASGGTAIEQSRCEPVEVGGHARPKTWTRYVSAAVRRAVWKRDEGSCTFRGAGGRRCSSTHRLQLDHLYPYAWGGEATVDNLTLRCAAHNLHRAREHFGEAHMARFSRPRQGMNRSLAFRPARLPSGDPGGDGCPGPSEEAEHALTDEASWLGPSP
jgi:hypothetical protein